MFDLGMRTSDLGRQSSTLVPSLGVIYFIASRIERQRRSAPERDRRDSIGAQWIHGVVIDREVDRWLSP
jgi:hypothetical protein